MLAALVLLVAGVGTVWLRHVAEAPDAGRSSVPAPAGILAGPDERSDGADMATTRDTGDLAQLSPMPEVLGPSGTTVHIIDRIQRRQGMSRLFSGAHDIQLARGNETLMQPAERDAAIAHLPFLSERQKSDERSFIRYDPRTLESRVEGDPVDILLPQTGLTAKGVVDRVETVDGMLRWSGRILDFQEGGTFSVTHALQDGYAVGTFSTPLGHFALEAKDGWGWIATQSSDFFLPPGGDDGLHAPAPDSDLR